MGAALSSLAMVAMRASPSLRRTMDCHLGVVGFSHVNGLVALAPFENVGDGFAARFVAEQIQQGVAIENRCCGHIWLPPIAFPGACVRPIPPPTDCRRACRLRMPRAACRMVTAVTRLEQDAVGRGLDHGLGACFDLKLFAQPGRNDDLALAGEPNGVCFQCCTQRGYSYMSGKVRQLENVEIL